MSEFSDEFEEVHVARISADPLPSMTDLYNRMKRKPDEVTSSGKRQRVYQDGANIHHVDVEIFQQKGIQNDAGEDSTDAEQSGDLGNPQANFDEIDLSRLEEQERHALQAAEQAHNATVTRTHTPGSRKISRVLRRQNLTFDDVLDNIDDDDEGIRWRPCVSPDIDLLHRFIGKHVDNSDCYGCNRGLGFERVDHKVIRDLCDFITDLIRVTHLGEVCMLVSEYFEEKIRKKFNEGIAKTENAIQPWSPSSIHEHIIYHMKESSFIHSQIVSTLHEHLRILRYRQVYVTSKEAARSGRHLDIKDMRVVPSGHRMLMDTIKTLMFVMGKKPQEMSNFNPRFNVINSYTAAINPKVTQAPLEQTKSIYDTGDTGL
jgi:hypothetical protein